MYYIHIVKRFRAHCGFYAIENKLLLLLFDLSSTAVIPQIPGGRFFFSFRIAAVISSAVGGVESTEGSGVALAASAMRTGSSGGAGLLNCSWKWSFYLWSWSVSSQSGEQQRCHVVQMKQ